MVYNGQSHGGTTVTCAPSTSQVAGKPLPVLCRRIEQATTDASGGSGFAAPVTGTARQWDYTYDRFGQVLSVNGPRTDVADIERRTYHPDNDAVPGRRGNLATRTNSSGHVTQFTAYDANGRPTRIVDPNGVTATLSYHPRGWIASAALSDGVSTRTTTIAYQPNGTVQRITQPDGSFFQLGYDAAQRLTSITDNLGNSVSYTLDNVGNRIDEQFKDATGSLRQRVSRVFDALSRLQSVTGASR
jgi:YD repeat-containing protein